MQQSGPPFDGAKLLKKSSSARPLPAIAGKINITPLLKNSILMRYYRIRI
jgi:hypothetical protein